MRRPTIKQHLKDWDDTSTSSQSEDDEPSNARSGASGNLFHAFSPKFQSARDHSVGTRPAGKQTRSAWDDSSESDCDDRPPDQPMVSSTNIPEVEVSRDNWDESSGSSDSEDSEVWRYPSPQDIETREQTPPAVVRKALSESNVEFLEEDGA